MSDSRKNSAAGTSNSKDCVECQKTLKDHLKECADYGNLPALVTKCDDLPGGCSVGKPDTCPAPPPVCPTPCPPPPNCGVPATTFTCPASDCPPPPSAEQCGAKKPRVSCNANVANPCDVKPLSVDKKC